MPIQTSYGRQIRAKKKIEHPLQDRIRQHYSLMTRPDFSADVVIAGAGPAGISAAISAAAAGADCLLMEARRSPGGTVCHTGIFSLCGFFPQDSENTKLPAPWDTVLPSVSIPAGRMRVVPVTPWKFSRASHDLITRFPNLRFLANTPLTQGMHIRARALIDCTGNAALARLAGVETMENPPASPGMGFVLQGVDISDLAPGAMDITRVVMEEFRDFSMRIFPDLAFDFNGTLSVPGMLNLPVSWALAQDYDLKIMADKQLDAVLSFLNSMCTSMRHAFVCWRGHRVGQRSGPVIKGRGRAEFLESPQDHRCKVKGYWPSEMWKDATGASFKYLHRGFMCIPDSCLRADFHVPFFAGGRCISAAADAQGSVRVTGTGIETGRRAGVLAAEAAALGERHDVRL